MVGVRGVTKSTAKNVASRRVKAHNYNRNKKSRDIPKQRSGAVRRDKSGRPIEYSDPNKASFFLGY